MNSCGWNLLLQRQRTGDSFAYQLSVRSQSVVIKGSNITTEEPTELLLTSKENSVFLQAD